MTREEIAAKVRWPLIVSFVSVLNPLMIAPQLLQIWRTGETAGLSFAFLGILCFVQLGFASHGFFTRDRFIMASNGFAALMTFLTILSTVYFQYIVT